jgi:hypothetical protein
MLWFAARSARLSVGRLSDLVGAVARREGHPIPVRRLSDDDEA